jgi:hypothetical protein
MLLGKLFSRFPLKGAEVIECTKKSECESKTDRVDDTSLAFLIYVRDHGLIQKGKNFAKNINPPERHLMSRVARHLK